MTVDSEVRLRADARRNRDQILAAARDIFAAQGAEAPMEEIARSAGVGVGTLYRRFPDREALIRAVAQESFAQVLEDARAAATEEPTAWDALVRMVDRSSQLQVSVQLALVSQRARDTLHGDPKTGELRDALIGELAEITRAAQAEGMLRLDVGAGDVVALLALTLRQPSDVVARDRAVAIMLDGLRPQAAVATLPGRPRTADDLRTWQDGPIGDSAAFRPTADARPRAGAGDGAS